MRYVALAVALIVVIGATMGVAVGQPLQKKPVDPQQDLRRQKYDLERQIRAAKSEAAKDPDIQALQTKASEADKAYGKALTDTPAVKEADQKITDLQKQIKDLQKQLGDLHKQKQDAVKAADATEPIKVLKQAQTDAQAAVTKAVNEKPAVKALLEKLDQLMKQLAPPVPPPQPAKEKPAEEKPAEK